MYESLQVVVNVHTN